MTFDFNDIRRIAGETFGEACVLQGENAFSLALDGATVSFASLPGEQGTVLVRARVLDLAAVPRKGGLATAALAGNFFWGGTRGATLSVGADDALYLTERRHVADLADAASLGGCVDDFLSAIADWRGRSALYE